MRAQNSNKKIWPPNTGTQQATVQQASVTLATGLVATKLVLLIVNSRTDTHKFYYQCWTDNIICISPGWTDNRFFGFV